MGQLTGSSFNLYRIGQDAFTLEGYLIVQQPNGREIIVSRAKKVVVYLQSKEPGFFPRECVTVARGDEALALHRETVASFPHASASVVARGASIEPLFSGFIAENFAPCLQRSRCFRSEGGFYTLLTFERRGKSRGSSGLQEIQELFASVAESVYFVPKQNTVGVFAQGLRRDTHSSHHAGRFDFRAGRIQAYC